MKNRKGVFGAVALSLLAVLVYANRDRIHFDWGMFLEQLRFVDWWHVAAAVGLIYATFLFRAFRWSIFLAGTKRVSPIALLGSQFIGFTAVALFGRLADLTRPYLVARRVQMDVSSQVAVYTIERMFDLGAAAAIFSVALLFAPKDLPHHEIFIRTGVVSVAGTVAIAIFAGLIRAMGGVIASNIRAVLRRFSEPLGQSVAEKILGFRKGLNAIPSGMGLLWTATLSLAMWGMIGLAYVETLRAFVATPELAGVSYSRTMLLMGASIGGSLLQLPVVGWFTQIAVTAAAMHAFYGAPIEAATACGAILLFVTFLSIVPAGLVYARVEHVSLKKVATEASVESAT
jgi:glycosyltransferase 2 family protein